MTPVLTTLLTRLTALRGARRDRRVQQHLDGLTALVLRESREPTGPAARAEILTGLFQQAGFGPVRRLRAAPGELALAETAASWERFVRGNAVMTESSLDTQSALESVLHELADWVRDPAGPVPEQVGRRLADELWLDAESFGHGLILIQDLCERLHADRADRFRMVSALTVGFTQGTRQRVLAEQTAIHQGRAEALTKAQRHRSAQRGQFLACYGEFGIAMGLLDAAGRVLVANPALRELLRRTDAQLIGTALSELVDQVDAGHTASACETVRAHCPHVYLTVRLRAAEVHLALHWSEDGTSEGAVHLVVDHEPVTRLSPDWLRQAAGPDPVTGLPGPQYFAHRLEQALRGASQQEPISLCLVRLRAWTGVRRAHGAAAAEAVLRAIVPRLIAACDAAHLLARIEPDTFALLLTGRDAWTRGMDLAARCRDWVGAAVHHGDRLLLLDPAVALATSTGQVGGHELVRRGLGRLEQPGPVLAPVPRPAPAERDLLVELPAAFRREEVELAYLPTVRLADNTLVAAEATLRWRHPTRGLVPIDHLIQRAEDIGLRLPLTALFRTACAHARGWHEELGRSAPHLIVNVPAWLARTDRLVGQVTGVLSKTGLPPASVHLGLTEAGLLCEHGGIRPHLPLLAGHGLALRLNNFGLTFARFDQLPELTLREIAIPSPRGPGDGASAAQCRQTVTEHLVRLGRQLSHAITLQGVASATDVALAHAIGADYVQGPSLGEPCPAEEIAHRVLHPVPPLP
ncbi:EAL domain-containing protein [Kutzneria albida]|uniref:EAL domain-containing protein n=1 Tax=Kutzneria albida TaxID=43357 RepID=UPI0011DE38A0|nr:EAL domain-containing protein [Kutzneria albida]